MLYSDDVDRPPQLIRFKNRLSDLIDGYRCIRRGQFGGSVDDGIQETGDRTRIRFVSDQKFSVPVPSHPQLTMQHQQISVLAVNVQVFAKVLSISHEVDGGCHTVCQQCRDAGADFHMAAPLLSSRKDFGWCKAGDVEEVIINKRGRSVFEYNEIDSFFSVNKNIFN